MPGDNTPKYRSFDNRHLDLIPFLKDLDPKTMSGLRLASRVFPFKVNAYVLGNLIDWSAVPNDPIYRLIFPHHDMLLPEDAAVLSRLIDGGAGAAEVDRTVRRIRNGMNPHASGQLHNRPYLDGVPIEGIQHKYAETVLYFPKQGQTCHAYCTFCFRWPQFVESGAPRFEGRDVEVLGRYLAGNPGVTDLLLTGGDPMVMSAHRLKAYVDLLLRPELAHIETVRFGTKAMSWWPFRFFAEEDSDELLGLLSRLVDVGKHVAIMAHIDHWRELKPEPFQIAVAALRRAGVTIRSQAPVLRHVNADADVWRRMWQEQVRLGIVPYYMFVARDTGAHHYFSIPLVRAHEIYRGAFSRLSGLGRTARGPVMSADSGKVQVLGTMESQGQKHFVLTYLQARRPELVQKPFLAKFSETATWLDELERSDGFAAQPFATVSEGNDRLPRVGRSE